MKKTALVLIAAAILVFAFTANAMAGTSSGTIDWNTAKTLPVNQDPTTPHKGYAQTTTKCLVCHAVHKANPGGQVLLGDTVANACNYCHVSTSAISIKVVYGGDHSDLGVNDTDKGHEMVSCTGCHAVHGANTVNQEKLSSKILKADPAAAQAGPGTDWDLTNGSELGALSAYCTQCHPYYVGTYADTDTDGDVNDKMWASTYGAVNFGESTPETTDDYVYNSHIMTAPLKDLTVYQPDNGAIQVGGQVAWAGTPYCTSCHDAGRGTGLSTDSFPHQTLGARFMKSAGFVGDTATNAASPSEDGVCLKCHRDAADSGVGFDF